MGIGTTVSQPFVYQSFAHSFALFCTRAKLNPFVFNRFRTLRQKTGGGVHPSSQKPISLWPYLRVASLPRYLLTSLLRASLLARADPRPAGKDVRLSCSERRPLVRLFRRSRRHTASLGAITE